MRKIMATTLAIMLAACAYASADANIAVVYFSGTGNTERVAQAIAETTGGDIHEIVPAEPYTSADLRWTDPDSRVNYEHENYDSIRPEIAQEIDLDGYDVVFLGYPLWWGEAPAIVLSFLDDEDLSGKTIIPFCTSSSSPLGDSADRLEEYEGSGDWLTGRRFRSRATERDVRSWLADFGF